MLALIALVAAVLALIVIVAEPMAGVALMLFVAPFGPLVRITFGTSVDPGQVALALTLASWLGRKILAAKENRADWKTLPLAQVLRRPVAISLIVFLAVTALTFFPARSFELWFKEWLKWAEMLIVFALVASEPSPRKRVFVLGAVLASLAFQGAFGVLQFGLLGFGPKEFEILGGRFWRAHGTLEQPNPFGGYVGMLWPLAAGVLAAVLAHQSDRFRSGQTGWRTLVFILAGIAMLAGLGGLVGSWSRGAWLGAGAAVLVMALAAFKKPILGFGVVLAALAVLMGLYAANALPASIRSRLTDFTAQFTAVDVRGASISPANYAVIERLAHWQAGLNMIEAEPWTGVGFGNYEAAYDQYRLINWPIALAHAHNYYINIWAETGLFGLMTYLAFWMCVFVVTWRTARNPSAGAWRFVALGLMGTWAHLAAHNVVDNLYVANMTLLIGALLGILNAEFRMQKESA
ncbi:MAG TPA: O-antigen ligase family protein [Thermoflexales bacterium]|nr:O-antigen ligase family protein [Thermoflexales bacterium]